jgi:hypothetical protein
MANGTEGRMRKSARRAAPGHEARLRERRESALAQHEAEYKLMASGKKPIRSTRGGMPGSDAHRDMDGFDENEELRRFELAVKKTQFAVAAKLAANLNEHAQRGGTLPAAWLGPKCMRSKKDVAYRQREAETREAELGNRNSYV